MTSASTDTTAIWRAFERTVQADPGATALSTLGASVTRQELATRASRIASALRGARVREHSVVALMLPNSVEFVAAFLAVTQLPALAALVSTRYRDTELRAICADIRPDAILVSPQHAAGIARLLDIERQHEIDLPGTDQGLRLLCVRRPGPAAVLDVRERFGLRDPGSFPALFKFSSGSTGAPKAVLWTAANIRAAASNVVQTLGLGESDVVLTPVPLSHSYGFDLGILPMIFAGTSLVIRSRFAPKMILADLIDERVSVFLGVPAMYRVLNRTRLDPVPDLSSVRYLLSSTAPLPISQIETFRRQFNARIFQHYGSSETGGISLHVPSEIARRPGSVGRAMKNVSVSVVDTNGETLPPDCRGEVVIGGEATAAGYVQGEIAHDGNGFRDGRYWTGDAGFLDADGFLYLDGSRAGVTHVGGWKVSLSEVAAVLESHPCVVESAVTALTNPRRKKRVIAAVTLHDPVEEAELIAFCQDRLADYKVPRRVHILEELPRTASGKVALSEEDLPA
jgi:Acyl-CoA synthetases (AMP-forming)/AMP-acid ligases II